MRQRNRCRILIAIWAALLVAGCNDNNGPTAAAAPSRNDNAQPATRDDAGDCQNSHLPAYQVQAACDRAIEKNLREIRRVTLSPIGKTQILGSFNGCDYGKEYRLMNGYTLECRSYGYAYAYGPRVEVLNYSSAIIDGSRYSVSIK